MKSVLLSVKPQHVANILNGIKTLEIRKRFPKDYVGWVYIYCTKNGGILAVHKKNGLVEYSYRKGKAKPNVINHLNGKVVARFWCDKVEYVENTYDEFRWGEEDYSTETLNPDVLYEKSCLSFEEMDKYLKGDCGCAIHITNLEIFDKPKEISKFSIKVFPHRKDNLMTRYLTRAPQSWCYVEI